MWPKTELNLDYIDYIDHTLYKWHIQIIEGGTIKNLEEFRNVPGRLQQLVKVMKI
jgi:hypothetical protein